MEPPNGKFPQCSTGFILGGFHFLDPLGGLGSDGCWLVQRRQGVGPWFEKWLLAEGLGLGV